MLWSTLSKAFAKSKYIVSTFFPFLALLMMKGNKYNMWEGKVGAAVYAGLDEDYYETINEGVTNDWC